VQLSVVAEVDVGSADSYEQHGVFGVVFGHVQRVYRTAGLVQVGTGSLWLLGILAVEPSTLQRVYLGGAGVVVQR
jgi:hypothetical protein